MSALDATRAAAIGAGLTAEQADELARNLVAGLPTAIEDAAVEVVEHRVAQKWLELDAGAQERLVSALVDALTGELDLDRGWLCADCGERFVDESPEESPDGTFYCGNCAPDHSFMCAKCGVQCWGACEEIDGDPYCEGCAEELRNNDCPDCRGTGIGHGPPDVSRCGRCGGSGIRKRERDPDDYADEMRDRAWDRAHENY